MPSSFRFRIATVADLLPIQTDITTQNNDIWTEVARAEAAEAAETARAEAAEAAETARAEAAEAGFATPGAIVAAIATEVTNRNAVIATETARAEAAEAAAIFSGTVSSNAGSVVVESVNTLQQAKMAVSHLLSQATLSVAGGTGGASQVNMVAGPSGGVVGTTDNAGTPRNALDDGSGNAVVAGSLTVGGVAVPTSAGITTAIGVETARAEAAEAAETTRAEAAEAAETAARIQNDPIGIIDGAGTFSSPSVGQFALTLGAVPVDTGHAVYAVTQGAVRVNGIEGILGANSFGTDVPDATHPRIDTVVVQYNGGPFDGWDTLARTGTPAASPVPPTLPYGYMPLFDVLVPANAASATDCTVQTDRRVGTNGSTRFFVMPDLAYSNSLVAQVLTPVTVSTASLTAMPFDTIPVSESPGFTVIGGQPYTFLDNGFIWEAQFTFSASAAGTYREVTIHMPTGGDVITDWRPPRSSGATVVRVSGIVLSNPAPGQLITMFAEHDAGVDLTVTAELHAKRL